MTDVVDSLVDLCEEHLKRISELQTRVSQLESENQRLRQQLNEVDYVRSHSGDLPLGPVGCHALAVAGDRGREPQRGLLETVVLRTPEEGA